MENNLEYIEALRMILRLTMKRYIVLKTKYTTHHIEVLMGTCSDRGSLKWIGETDYLSTEDYKDPEARRSHIDGGDLFPRVFFLAESLCAELEAWFKIRNLSITDLITPTDY